MQSWLRNAVTRLFGRRPRNTHPPAGRSRRGSAWRPRLESLEDRTVPTITVSGLNTAAGTVTFTGTASDETLILARVEISAGVFVLMHNVSDSELASSVDLDRDTPGEQTLTLGDPAATAPLITVDLGNGSNKLTLDTSWTFNHAVTFTGGTGSDEVVGNNTANTWTITGARSGTATLTAGGATNVTFSAVETLTAGTGSDTLQGENIAPRTWTLDTAQTYTDGTNPITFSGFDTLKGGTNADTFNIKKNLAISLEGGAGNDAFAFSRNGTSPVRLSGSIDGGAGTDSLDYSDYAVTGDHTVYVTLTDKGSTDGYQGTELSLSGTFNNIDTVTGSGATASTLASPNVVGTFTVSGSGNNYAAVYSLTTHTLNFSGLRNLVGGTDNDTFDVTTAHTGNLDGRAGDDVLNVSAAVTGTITGGTGSDTLDHTAYSAAVVGVTLTGGTAAGYNGIDSLVSGGFVSIDTLKAGSHAGADSFKGGQAASTWSLDTSSGAFWTYLDNSLSNGLVLRNFDSLVGGAAADDFVVKSNTAFTGSIHGGDGTNSLSYAHASNTSGISMSISGTDAGGVGSLTFAAISSVVGTAQADTFDFTAASARLSGMITAGGGANGLVYSGYTAGVRVNLAGTATGTASISGIVSVTGGSGNDVLIGSTTNDTLNGGAGNDVLVGGDGNDALSGAAGYDILLGSDGVDALNGGSEDDVLAGGVTTYDNNVTALNALMAEWARTDVSYATRIARLYGNASAGLNGTYRLNSNTIDGDGDIDALTGGAGLDGLDWFLVTTADADTNNASGSESVRTVS